MSKNEMAVSLNSKDNKPAIASTPATGLTNVFSDMSSFETALRMADCLANSTVVPKDYQNNTGNCMIAIEMAARINTSPMMVMQNLFVVNGRPAWSAQWIIAMINASRRYKTELQFEFGNDASDGGLSCYAWVEDWNGHRVCGPKITMNMAKEEGWLGKNGSKWKTMPSVMIQYRAASFFGRMNCPDMIMGIYSQEEVIDMEASSLPVDGLGMMIDPNTGEVVDTPLIPDKTVEVDKPITQEQRQELFRHAKDKLGEKSNDILKELLNEEGFESTTDMPTSVWKRLMEKITDLGNDLFGNESSSGNAVNK